MGYQTVSICPALDGAPAIYGGSRSISNPLKITVSLNTDEKVCPITGIRFDGQDAVSIGTCTQDGFTLTVTCKPPALAKGQYVVTLQHYSGGQHEGTLSTYLLIT